MNKSQLLAITSPTKLFSSGGIKAEYRALVLKWHPDKSGGDDEVFRHVTKLYKTGLTRLSAGAWDETVNIDKYTDASGKTYKIRYKSKHAFELGTMYVGSKTIVYVVNPKFKVLVENAVARLDALKVSSKMNVFKEQYQKVKQVIYSEEFILVIFEKDSKYLLLKDILAYYKLLPARHVAWILSRLYSFNCFLEYNMLSHNNLALDTIFVDPAGHSILVHGWWYATPIDNKLVGLPKRTSSLTDMTDKISNYARDIELIRLIARELFGDSFGHKIRNNPDVPKAFHLWVTLSSGISEPIKEYEAYEKILALSWGKKQFTNMPLTEKELYKE